MFVDSFVFNILFHFVNVDFFIAFEVYIYLKKYSIISGYLWKITWKNSRKSCHLSLHLMPFSRFLFTMLAWNFNSFFFRFCNLLENFFEENDSHFVRPIAIYKQAMYSIWLSFADGRVKCLPSKIRSNSRYFVCPEILLLTKKWLLIFKIE